ncbi:MAG: hypothetical protein HY427_02970 [Candidatus Levybacteria bacterium]|nr:hypothetical protein [Candidatus Levybacteria bacterium]
MEPTTQENITNTPNIQPQFQTPPQPRKPAFNKRTAILASTVIIALVIIVGIIGYIFKDYLFLLGVERKDPTPTAFLQDTKKTYANDYWGFSVKYPKNWFFNEGQSGQYYSFASYNQEDYPVGYIPNKQNLNMIVRILNESAYDRYASPTAKIREISGLEAIEVEERSALGPRDRDIIRKYNSEEMLNDHYTRSYYIKRNGYAFAIIADRADSALISNFDEFVSDFQFTKTREYMSETGNPPKGKFYSQDVKLGYIFEYPGNFTVKGDSYAAFFYPPTTEMNPLFAPYIKVEPIDNIYNDSELFEENIIQVASGFCDASGPTGSTYCPKESIALKKFMNKYNAEGYEVQRIRVNESYLGSKSKTKQNETLFVYKLDTPDNFMIMFTASEPEINNELKEIAETFKYLPIKE